MSGRGLKIHYGSYWAGLTGGGQPPSPSGKTEETLPRLGSIIILLTVVISEILDTSLQSRLKS